MKAKCIYTCVVHVFLVKVFSFHSNVSIEKERDENLNKKKKF